MILEHTFTSTTETSISISGVAGEKYDFSVSAVNAAGESEMSLVSDTGTAQLPGMVH